MTTKIIYSCNLCPNNSEQGKVVALIRAVGGFRTSEQEKDSQVHLCAPCIVRLQKYFESMQKDIKSNYVETGGM